MLPTRTTGGHFTSDCIATTRSSPLQPIYHFSQITATKILKLPCIHACLCNCASSGEVLEVALLKSVLQS